MAKRRTLRPPVGGSAEAIRELPVDQLLLDAHNPRLASGAGADTQLDILRILWNQMAVDEVAFSINANGYFQEEPLFVIPEDPANVGDKARYIAVEGNRRLAAVKLLRDQKLRDMVGATELPTPTPQRIEELAELPVSVYADRKTLWRYCGFRHINGVQPWDAFSKAEYVATVFEQYGVPLAEIAERIGDRHATVRRLYRGYKVLQQAEARSLFDRADRYKKRFYFSHLYTALDQPEFQTFLGVTAEESLRPNPVPKRHLDDLRDLMTWIYGRKSASVEPLVRNQNPDLNTLRVVIGNRASLSALRAGIPLSRAHEIGIGDKRRFRDSLVAAKDDLQQAKATVTTGYSGEEDLHQTICDIEAYTRSLLAEMASKRSLVRT